MADWLTLERVVVGRRGRSGSPTAGGFVTTQTADLIRTRGCRRYQDLSQCPFADCGCESPIRDRASIQAQAGVPTPPGSEATWGLKHSKISRSQDLREELPGSSILRIREYLVSRSLFDNLAKVHHHEVRAHFPSEAHLMGDRNHRHPL